MQDSVVVDLVPEAPTAGDVYVLCSDGLSGMISDDDILTSSKQHADPQALATDLVARANANGGEDNVTVVVIQVR